ncbi:conjugal transfer protein TraF [Breznakiella homolactica]|uniref:PorV/PorQ family protein n=1 Tax=Breznakiella homolactica TaxID=2798577 RepID=A0A7T8B9F5_9SPIR|nr:conjugal transfer protein TraF [Breznakiella homolactica]QQO07910.1 conjugal transfer protein TraF [Breznakiella homolactica]
MRNKTRLIPAALIFIFCGAALSAEKIAPFTMPSARLNAMGGSHVAFAEDVDVLLINPASLASVKQFSVAEITLGTHGPILELADFIGEIADWIEDDSDNPLDLSGISKLLDKNGRMALGLDLGGPVSLAFVRNGFGIGFFDRAYVDIAINGMSMRATANADAILVGGYGFRLMEKGSHILDAGFTLKGLFRIGSTSSYSLLRFTQFGDLLSMDTTAGIGLDLGVRYEFAKLFSAAVVCNDVYSPVYVTPDLMKDPDERRDPYWDTVAPRLNLGVMVNALNWKYLGISVMADYRDILDFMNPIPRNPILNISLGTEVRILNRIFLRAGIQDALPACGIGLDLWICKLDFALYGKELGMDPGTRPVYAMTLGLLFRY